MRKDLPITLAALFALSAGLFPALAHSHALDPQFDCKSDPNAFIAALIDDQSIDAAPMRVEANSVNAFRPKHGSDLTAFGFHVYAVLGYRPDDALFKKGSGDPIASPLYGAVVSGPAEAVEQRVRQSGSDAVVHQVMPLLLTAIVCGGH